MNNHIKAVVSKEVKEVWLRKDYLLTLLLNTVIFLGVGYIFISQATQNETIKKLFMELTFIIIPPFAMWILSFPFIQEKFGDEKLLRRFESLLTTPISLPKLWSGKILSIFILSYPVIILIVILFSFIWYFLAGLNPIFILSIPVWLMALLISPMIPMIYAAFSSWSILRFSHPRLMEALNFFAIGLSVLVFLSSGKIVESIASGHIVNWLIIGYSIIGIFLATSLVLFLIYELDKENVTL
ncbi:hypothetical protein [Methanobacterium sp.]|uniref:hypothetical protein n=1 Tax=Methanobacterium sp. TaxID=2164 RepID=UPI0025D1E01D|nr:hypothetical protein [Methanobacterium sp.]MBI5460158.1 hypothetical protein [Methanobacterium sp.]